jgi:hypothetical protein
MKIYKKGNYIYLVNASGDIKQDHANEVKITKTNVANETYSIYSDDLGVNNVTFSELTQENGTAYASVSAWELWYAENTGFNPASGGSGAGTVINTVSNFAGLPDPTLVSNDFYWCEASQGTKWLPFSVGGTYYPLGMYYSNGVTWEYSESPYQATLSEVNTGTNTDKFVSASTFENATKWTTKVPYTGATSDVNLGEFGIQLGNLEFDTAPTDIPTTVGSMVWNDADGTLDLKLKGGNVTLQVGQEQVLRVVNKTSTNVTLSEANYQAVRVTGSQGQRLKVDLAQATNDTLSAETIGLVTETINNNEEGFITTSGLVRGINTTGSLQSETWVDGDIVYLSPTTAGNLTNIKPIAPNHLIIIGYVVSAHITQGTIFVKVDNGYELDELHNVLINGSLANNDVIQYDSATLLWKNRPFSTAISSEFVFVNQKADLPTASGGIITLLANKTYYFTTTIDLTGDRLVGGINSTILGASSENCYIKSTGLSSSTALITSIYSLPIRNITLTHGTALNLDGDGVTTALDWFGVNFTDCATVGTIKDYTNFIMNDSAFLNSQGLTFDGTIGTIGMTNCLFDCTTGGTAMILPSTLTVSRRFRIIYSSFVTLSGETGINASASATIGDEKYILDTINFSGGGTYQSGLDATSNKSLFANCVGITNTSTRGFMYMVNNATDTPIGVPNVNTWVKASGTTTSSTLSKFSHTSNRLTYNGAFNQSFVVHINTSVRSAGTNQVISIGIAKNGNIIAESEMTIRTTTSNQEYPGSTTAIVDLVNTDYLEVFVKNTSSTDIRLSDLNMNVTKIPV